MGKKENSRMVPKIFISLTGQRLLEHFKLEFSIVTSYQTTTRKHLFSVMRMGVFSLFKRLYYKKCLQFAREF